MVAPNRIYSEYRDKPKANAWLNITGAIAAPLELLFERIRTSYDIDNATPYEIDVLARIVALDPSVDGLIGALGIDPVETKRILIRAKISTNNGDVTIDSIIDALRFITSAENLRVIDHDDMSFSVIFSEEITQLERTILSNFNVVPRSQGVRFRGFTEVGTVTQFGPDQFGGATAQYGYLYGD